MNEWLSNNIVALATVIIMVLGGAYFLGELNYHVSQIDDDLDGIHVRLDSINGKVREHEIELAVIEARRDRGN